MTSDPHQHVFFDPTGRRWRRLKLLLILTAAGLTLATLVFWHEIDRTPTHLGSAGSPLTPGPSNPAEAAPIIGTGPLVRAARIEHGPADARAVDPLTGATLRTVTRQEAEELGDARYVLDRYGYSTAAHKTISLTFDDGPDPRWTPRILDLLAKHHVQATFFVVGSAAVRHPEIMARLKRDGHAVGNHTFTHPLLTPKTATRELVRTDRIIRATTGVGTNLFRLPYDGDLGKVSDAGINAVIAVQRLGYLISLDDFDSNDWRFGDAATEPSAAIPFPPANQDNITVLLHDGGGDRAETLRYLGRLIPWARAHGFTFHSLPQVSQQVKDGTRTVTASLWDRATYWVYRVQWYGPNVVLHLLFLLAIASVVAGSCLNVALALIRRRWNRYRWTDLAEDFAGPNVSVVIAAFNEEAVIGKTLLSLRTSRYSHIVELIVVDDGSTDRTGEIVAAVAAEDSRIRLLRQENSGKAAALNRGFRNATGHVVVTLDADTVFMPTTVGHLVRHFTVGRFDRRRLGAVCGVIRVGNRRNLLTRWQALEIVTQLGVERGAQDQMHGIMIVPGACAAWRRDAVLHAGGYSHATLTEDCDMALTLQQLGYRVTQDDSAVCYTEVPESVRALTRQRFRWLYGNLQALWKHRDMILNPHFGWLGMVTLPQAVVSVALPVVFLPFVYGMAVLTFQGEGLDVILLYGSLFLVVQLMSACAGIWLTGERAGHLLMVPLYRVIYEPLRAYLLYRSVVMILRGTRLGWNKLQRTGNVVVPAAEQRVEVGGLSK